MNEVLKVIKSRRSVRSYTQEQLSDEVLEQIIEAGIYAPTAHNEQPWHFTVIQNPEMLRHINDMVRVEMVNSDFEWARNIASNAGFCVTYNAPTLIIVSGRKDGMAWRVDCAAAMENMMLAAESMNIGSVCLGLMRYLFALPEEVKKLDIPEGYVPFYGMVFGMKVEGKEQPVPARNRDVVNYFR